MPRVKLLGLAWAAWAALYAPALRADDHPDSGKPAARAPAAQPYLSRAASAPTPAQATVTAPATGAPAPAAPRPDSDTGAGAGDNPSPAAGVPYQAYSLYDGAAGEGAAGGDPRSAEFRSLPAWLHAHAVAIYGGAGASYVVAQYPASTDDNVAWQVFAGMRTRYLGAEIDAHTLGYYRAQVNGQTVEVGTDMVSLSLMGFLPLAEDTDFYARYGRTAWSVNANGAGGSTASAVTSGTTGTAAAGLEFRQGALLLRVEARRFPRVYQSDAYLSIGVSVGGYIH